MDSNEILVCWTTVTDDGLLIGIGTSQMIPEDHASVAVIESFAELAAQINYFTAKAANMFGPQLTDDIGEMA